MVNYLDFFSNPLVLILVLIVVLVSGIAIMLWRKNKKLTNKKSGASEASEVVLEDKLPENSSNISEETELDEVDEYHQPEPRVPRSQMDHARSQMDQTRSQMDQTRSQLDQTRSQLGHDNHHQFQEKIGAINDLKTKDDFYLVDDESFKTDEPFFEDEEEGIVFRDIESDYYGVVDEEDEASHELVEKISKDMEEIDKSNQ
jgi:hypothetical protein